MRRLLARYPAGPKLCTSEPATRYQPSTSTKKMILNGNEIVAGGSIIMPIDMRTVATPADVPLRVLVPSFMISELRRAFEIGFLLFLPFLIIDMVVASILMSMGMMMLPSAMISLPFKIIFFVLVDGWYLVAGSLVQSFGS